MFLVHTVQDTIRIAADALASNTILSLQNEIDKKYPNRVLMDVGLVIGRYDNINNGERRKHEQQKIQQHRQWNAQKRNNSNKRQRTMIGMKSLNSSVSVVDKRLLLPDSDGGLVRIGHGVCVAGDSGNHYDCTFQLIVFRPFVNEVCVGKIEHSSPDGIYVTIGYFRNIFIPAYWMLNPSQYDPTRGVWVWTPEYSDDNDADNNDDNKNYSSEHNPIKIKVEDGGCMTTSDVVESAATAAVESGNRYEMDVGAEIRFKVKSINFTQITNTAKGMQATTISMGSQHVSSTTTTSSGPETVGSSAGVGGTVGSVSGTSGSGMTDDSRPVLSRRRSSSVTGTDETVTKQLPSAMQIIASICEDGLGLTSWWTTSVEEEEKEEELDVSGDGENRDNDNDIDHYDDEDYYTTEAVEY
jgi:DNA-directed RNA polymerase subunit E'/Rpb7